MKIKLLFVLLFLSASSVLAAEQNQEQGQSQSDNNNIIYSDQALAQIYFYEDSSELSPQEIAILRQSEQYRNNNPTGIKPFVRPDGSVVMVFGVGQQTVVCAVLQITDVELQPGELVQNVHLGDTARWLIEPAVTGSDANQIEHLIIKPFDVGLDTTLVVTTNRRTYHFRLKSNRHDFMPRITFVYPDDVQAKWQAIKARQPQDYDRQIIPATGEYLGNLDFGYVIQGTASWKPTRVYNDGHKTILEMPVIMRQQEAPTLLIVRKEGGLFADEELVLVNYRVQNNRYIVDAVFDKAVMIIGIGDSQDRVTIYRSQEER
jgi:type IV secretion system protein VirB9